MPERKDPPKRAVVVDDLKRTPWRSIGPATMGGRVSALAFVPGSPKSYYVGYATGGLWKTTNRGTTFAPVFDDKETSSIGAVVCRDAPFNWEGWTAEERKGKSRKELTEAGKGKIVWVGTGEGNGRNSSSWGHGVYRSTDAGGTFEHCGLAATHDIPMMAVDPRNPDVCYVAALGHLWGPNPERGVYKTADGGKTWDHALKIDEDTGCCDIALDPENPDTVYAAVYARRRTAWSFTSGGKEGGVYKSTDAGKSWRKLTHGLPGQTGRIGLAVFPKNPQILYAVVESNEGGGVHIRDDRSKSGGVFRSEDGGETWTRQSVRTPRVFYFARIYVDPVDDQRVYLVGWVVEMSEDGGKRFRAGIGEKIHVDHHAFLIDPDDPEHLVDGNDGGVYESFDRGKSWNFHNTMAVGQFYNVAVDMSDPYRVAGGLQDNGTWVGPSATGLEEGKWKDGTTNASLTNADWGFVLWGDGFHAAFDPTDPDTVYGEWQGGNLTRVNLRTGRKKYIAPQQKEGGPRFRFNWNSPFFVSAHDPKVLYLGGNYVFRLRERGDKWDRISEDLTTMDPGKMETVGSNAETHCTVVSLAESVIDRHQLWAGSDDGLVHVTTDGGKAWKNVTPAAVAGRYVSRIEPSHHDARTAYVSVDGHRSDDMDPLVLVTTDLGATWKEITGDLPKGASVKVVREDWQNPDVLYCGTETGVYASFDRGKHWLRFNAKALPTVPVDDIVQHPREFDLVLGTHGRSIWILDDGSYLGQVTPDVLKSDAHLFDTKPAKNRALGLYPGLWTDHVFRAVNPPMGAVINYWLREFTGEDVSVVIEDARGTEVAKLPGSGAPGFNRVVWDLQPYEWLRLPDQGEEPEQAFFVPPGEYKVTLKYGKQKLVKTLTVRESM